MRRVILLVALLFVIASFFVLGLALRMPSARPSAMADPKADLATSPAVEQTLERLREQQDASLSQIADLRSTISRLQGDLQKDSSATAQGPGGAGGPESLLVLGGGVFGHAGIEPARPAQGAIDKVMGVIHSRPDDGILVEGHSDSSATTSNSAAVFEATKRISLLRAQAVARMLRVEFLLARYHADGSLDSSFGTGGVVRTDFGGRFDSAAALVLQTDRKLVAAGFSNASGDFDFALARYVTTDEPLAVPPKCGGRRPTILGTSGSDTLRGTTGPDVILGLAGNDTIRGLAGNDMIYGGPGRDQLIGNDGNDRLFGEDQNDQLFGDKGRDRLDGGSGRDACRTGETARRCEGKPASSKPAPGERPEAPPKPPKPPCPPVGNFPCS